MKNDVKQRMLDLLADEALSSIDKDESVELEKLKRKYPDVASAADFESVVAGFQMASTGIEEEMPEYLKNRISEQADDFWRETHGREEQFVVSAPEAEDAPRTSFTQWLGWTVAGFACVALVANLWYSGFGPTQIAKNGTGEVPTETQPLTIEEKRSALLASADKVRTEWSSPQEDLNVAGDVVWSDEKQEGYMRFRGLPVNDRSKETYQLWIFDETQDEATPIDGGVFDVTRTGEAIVPIDPNLRVRGPKAFAVTVEKPGGVMVSKREKIVALAKV